ncbi:MAG: hypothetical protein RLZZ298_475 [Pseudomonadota bacterium]
MSTMIFEVYDALKDAGASEEKAAKAATALADYDSRFNRIDAEPVVMKLMIGGTLALSGTVVGLLFNIMLKGIKISS